MVEEAVAHTGVYFVVDTLDEGLFLKDLGTHRLRDLSRAEHLRQLCATDLPIDFPALRSLDRMSHNLPLQLTSFVGREREIAGAEREMYGFETITLTPFDLACVEPGLMSPEEIAWLNAYHAQVRKTLSPRVDAKTKKWLREATRAI